VRSSPNKNLFKKPVNRNNIAKNNYYKNKEVKAEAWPGYAMQNDGGGWFSYIGNGIYKVPLYSYKFSTFFIFCLSKKTARYFKFSTSQSWTCFYINGQLYSICIIMIKGAIL